MLKVLEIKQTVEDTQLVQDMYKLEELIKDIIRLLERNNELNVEDFRFMNLVFGKTKMALTKVNTLLKINNGGEIK